jgi:phytol kinase
VLSLLVGFMSVLSYAVRRFRFHPEWTRKTLHIGMGVVSLWFPILFRDVWPVGVLAVLATAWLWSARRIRPLQNIFGAVLQDVRRQSWGEMYFAFAVALLFWLSQSIGSMLLFLIPIAILTFADASAALVGVRWGKRRLGSLNKTVEGSLAFFVTAFWVAKIALLFSGIAWPLSVGLAIVAAVVSTVVEALVRDGLDNLLVPLAVFAVLKICAP